MSSRKLTDADPLLRLRFEALQELWEKRFVFRRLIVTCTFRDEDEQYVLWNQGRVTPGRIVTFCDGRRKLSPHNYYPSRAIDVAVRLLPGDPEESVMKETISWNALLYRPLVELAQQVNLVSGGTFQMRDWPHLELPTPSSFPSA